MGQWYLYIAKCIDNSLYCGITDNTFKRIIRHNKGFGAKWFKKHGRGTIVYQEKYDSYAQARAREAQIKRWSRIKKDKLISGEYPSARQK